MHRKHCRCHQPAAWRRLCNTFALCNAIILLAMPNGEPGRAMRECTEVAASEGGRGREGGSRGSCLQHRELQTAGSCSLRLIAEQQLLAASPPSRRGPARPRPRPPSRPRPRPQEPQEPQPRRPPAAAAARAFVAFERRGHSSSGRACALSFTRDKTGRKQM